jgi:hypothetical protein
MPKNAGIYDRFFEDFECLLVLTFDELIALRRAFFALSAVDLTIPVTISFIVLFLSDSLESTLDSLCFCFSVLSLFGESNVSAIIF